MSNKNSEKDSGHGLKAIPVTNELFFESLLIENAYTFHGVNFIPLDNVGLVRVTGINKDTKEVSGNGTGKTRTWVCLARALYGRKALDGESPTLALKPDKKNFRIEVVFRRNGHRYLVRECKNHEKYGSGFTVFKDDKPFGRKHDPDALRAELQAILGRTYEEFVGTVVWKQDQVHVLLNGSPAQRTKWISDLFGLSAHDDLYAKFSEKLKRTTNKLHEYQESVGEIRQVKKQIAELGDLEQIAERVRTGKHEIKQLVEESDNISEKLEELRESEGDLKILANLAKEIAKSKYAKQFTTAKEAEQKHKELQERIEKLRNKLKQAKTQEQNAEELEKLVVRRKKAKKGLKRLYQEVFGGDAVLPTLQDLLPYKNEAIEKSASLNERLIAAKENQVTNKTAIAAQRKLDDLGYGNCDRKYLKDMLSTYKQSESDLEKKLAVLESVLETEKLLDGHVTKCPTCRQKIDVVKIKASVNQAKRDLKETKDGLKGVRKEISEFEDALELRVEADKKVGGKDVDPEKLQEKINQLHFRVTALNKMIEYAESIDACKARLSELDLPKKTLDAKLIRSRLEEATQEDSDVGNLCYLLRQYEDAVANLGIKSLQTKDDESVDVEKLTLLLERRRSKRKELEEELEDLQEKITVGRVRYEKLKQRLDDADKLKHSLAELRPRIKKIKKLERYVRVYKVLKQAYDKTGLRVTRLRELLEEIKSKLPTWTRILFTENNLRIDVTGDEKKIGFDIIQQSVENYTDQYGRKKVRRITKRYDAKYSSGSERTRISMCLMLCLADIAQSEKRCNLMVFDEFESGLDNVGKKIMAEQMIPLLKSLVPSLFLITHNLDIHNNEFDNHLQVTRENNKSLLNFVRTKPTTVSHKKQSKKDK